ncbi:MAG: sensor histidine kinase [Myxococcaceae bacterium]
MASDPSVHVEPDEVARSARVLSALTTATVDAFYVKDRQGRFLAANALAAASVGLRPEDMVGKLDSEVFSPQVWGRLRENDLAIMGSGEARTYEEAIFSAGVSWSWLTTKAPFRDAKGEVAGIVGISRDISALKRAQQALIESNSLLRSVVEGTPDAVFVKDREGRSLLANSALARLFGKQVEDLLGKDDSANWPPEVVRRFAEDDRRVMETGMPVTYEETLGAGESRIVFSTTKGPHRDADGRVIGVFGIARDITAQKQAEEQRVQLLANEREARAEAERANSAKDIFLATLSHELRTPLSTILLRTEQLLRATPEASPTRKALEAVRKSARDQAKLIEDLLDVARIATNKLELAREPVALALVVEAAVETMRAEAAEREIVLEVQLDPRSGTADADARRLGQVVTNLLSNALKFTPGGGRVSVGLERHGDHAVLRVSDTGSGIDPADLPKLFTRFFQSDRKLNRAKGGLGIGLAVVRDLVELHGGEVEAHSPGRGEGATFTVRLPVRPD